MNIKHKIEYFITTNNNWMFLLISLLMLLIAVLWKEPISLYLGATLFFTVFDVYGYYYLLTRSGNDSEINTENYFTYKFAYRSLQIGIQILLIMLIICISIINKFTIIPLLAFIISWWLGLCDYLYYIILKQYDMLEYNDMFWLWWTPYGIIFKIYKEPIKAEYLINFSLIGLLSSIMMIIYFEYL